MRKFSTTFLLASVFLVGVMGAPSLYAQGSQEPSGSTTGHGMMGGKENDDGGMKDMMKMMKMMKQMEKMSQMMDHCSSMMSAEKKSKDEMPKMTPKEPEQK